MKSPQYYRVFDYDKRLLPNLYLAALENTSKTIEEARRATGATVGYPAWGLIYYLLLSHLQPQNFNIILETGTNQVCTSIMLAQALRDSKRPGKVFTVELDNMNFQKALINFELAGVSDLIEPFNCDSREFLKMFISENPTVRIAFLDASHLFNDLLDEFEILYPALNAQSLVIFDNTYQIAEEFEDQRVNGALKEIVKRYGGNLINLEFVSWYTPGVALWQKGPF